MKLPAEPTFSSQAEFYEFSFLDELPHVHI